MILLTKILRTICFAALAAIVAFGSSTVWSAINGYRYKQMRDEWYGLTKSGNVLTLRATGSPNNMVETAVDRDLDGTPDFWRVSLWDNQPDVFVVYETEEAPKQVVSVLLGGGDQGSIVLQWDEQRKIMSSAQICLKDERQGSSDQYCYFDYNSDSQIDAIRMTTVNGEQWYLETEDEWIECLWPPNPDSRPIVAYAPDAKYVLRDSGWTNDEAE